MLKALRYDILRNVQCGGRVSMPLTEKPVRVGTLLDEEAFLKDQLMTHHGTVFLEDQHHDWDWKNGQFRYFTRVVELGATADVVVAYEVDANYVPPARLNYDPMTGKPLKRIEAPFADLVVGRCRYVAPGTCESAARKVEVLSAPDGGLEIRFAKGLNPTPLRDIPVQGVFLADSE